MYIGENYEFLKSNVLRLKTLPISDVQLKTLIKVQENKKIEKNIINKICSFVYILKDKKNKIGKIEYGSKGFNNNIVYYKEKKE